MSRSVEEPLVSVVVPTFQHVDYIAACLDSILAQRTSFPVEVLVGEDASTDGTREICQAYAAAHPDRIRLFLNDPKDKILLNGQPSGRANVLNLYRHCRGRYIAVCEGDDMLTDPDKLAMQVALLEAEPALAGTFHATAIIDVEGRPTGKDFRDSVPSTVTIQDVISGWSPFHLTSIVFRNGPFFRDPPHWTRVVGSFDLLIFTVTAAQGPIRGIQRNMSAYRKHGGGFTRTAIHQGASFNYLRIITWLHLDRWAKGRWAKEMGRVQEEHFTQMVRYLPRRERLRYWWRIVKADPLYALRHIGRTLRWLRVALQRCVLSNP